MAYGEASDLAGDAAQTPIPQGQTPQGHSAMHAAIAHIRGVQAGPKKVTPLFAPTERPWEPVTAGAPLDSSPTNPLAQSANTMQDASIASILQAAAQASGSPALTALANRAAAVASPALPGAGAFGTPPGTP
jgi:hypothetical protein